MTTNRVAGAALVGLALVVFWASRGLPLGSLRNPGPAYLPVALALVLLGFGALLGGAREGSAGEADAGRLAEGVRKVGRFEAK